MPKFFDELSDQHIEFISQQKLFFTATAPIDGRINLSPKGLDTFCCTDRKTFAYLDLTGSGNETAAHISQNGRMTIMFCSFTEKPLILRLYGKGRSIKRRDSDWADWHKHFKIEIGERQIIVLEIESVQTSCGFGVPVYELVEERPTLRTWASKKEIDQIPEYQRTKNIRSIDGLPTYLFDDEQQQDLPL